MKIYFAASIRGGRQDAGLYKELIKHMKTQGQVLTEHLGDAALTEMGEHGTPLEIYTRDVNWLKEADVVVAEVTTPSLGVGYELGTAHAEGKKILCLYRDDLRKLSPMVSGNEYNQIRAYKTVEEACILIDEFLNKFKE